LWVLDKIVPALVARVTGDDPLPGLSLAAWIEEGFGPVMAPTVARLGPEKLMEMLRLYPPAWGQLAPFEAKVQEVVAEFCTWPEKRTAFLADELPEQQDLDEGEEPEASGGRLK